MSQTETFLLPDGRKTSDLKVNELKKELEKIGKSKSGNKSELLNRLNESFVEIAKSASQIEKENSVLPESQIETHNSNQDEIEDNTLNDRRVVNFKPNSELAVDLDASDENQLDTSEINQSVDALDLYVPIDDSLNITDEAIQEERIQVTISRNDNDDVKHNEDDNDNDERRVVETITSDCRTVICNNNDSEKDEIIDMEYITGDDSSTKETRKVQLEEKPESKKEDNTETLENEPDELENIELEAQIEMYEVDNIDMDSQMEIYEEHKEENLDNSDRKDETIITNIEKDLRENEFLDVGATDETEEGEVVTIPITARLGKRKVKESSKEYLSPKKSKKKGLKETKGTGYIIEGPERVEPAQKPKNSISEILRIDRLVRPFTLVQLQDMLSLQGSVKEIWLNKIKSVAYVHYENESIANSARETIDGCRWPSINPKLLSCDFVCLKEMEWMKENGDSGTTPPNNFRQPQQEPKDSVKPQNTHKEQGPSQEQSKPANIDNEWKPMDKPKPTNRDHQQPSSHHKSDKTTDDSKKRERKEREAVPSDNNNNNSNNNNNNNNNKRRQQRSPHPHPDHHRRRHESPTKEQRQPRERVQEKSRENKNHQHHQQQQQQQQHQQQHQQQQPAPPPPPVAAAKLLEDIFRKTVTQPAIYWLPVAKEKKEEPIKKVVE